MTLAEDQNRGVVALVAWEATTTEGDPSETNGRSRPSHLLDCNCAIASSDPERNSVEG
jgi:hypothetical protein